jgi:hypothetical protein
VEAIKIRELNPNDIALVYSTWLRSYKFSSQFARNISKDVFFENHHKIITHILTLPDTRVSIACLEEDENVIIGWFCYQHLSNIAQYMFVKRGFRRMGVGRMLFDHSGLENPQFTHWTFDFSHVLQKNPQFIYNPYAI